MPGGWQYLAFWSGDEIDWKATRAGMPVSDLDAADLLLAEHPGWLHHVPHHPAGTWHIWDSTCHRPDASSEIRRVISELARRLDAVLASARQRYETTVRQQMPGAADLEIAKAVEKAMEADRWTAAAKYAAGLRRSAGETALASYLAGEAGCPQDLLADAHPEWLNFTTGTVDLRTRAIKAHDPADMLTYCLPFAYRPELTGACPQFMSMVSHVAGGKPEVADYIWRALGYALIGDNREQVIFFLNGPTKSGKSQVLYIMRQLLDVLGVESGADLICYTRHGRNARTENSIRGSRLVSISETEARMHIEEGQLKRLTGEPVIGIDQHYKTERIKTRVTFVIFCSTNSMPSVGDLDEGIRERVIVIPCGATIPPHLRDKGLADRILATEAEAILATLVYSASLYLNAPGNERLPRPADVELATETYRQGQNPAARYAADMLDVGQSWNSYLTGHQIWKSCLDWAAKDALPSRPRFYEMLEQVPGIRRDVISKQVVFRQVSWKKLVGVNQWP